MKLHFNNLLLLTFFVLLLIAMMKNSLILIMLIQLEESFFFNNQSTKQSKIEIEIDDLFANPEVVNKFQNKASNILITTPETETFLFNKFFYRSYKCSYYL